MDELFEVFDEQAQASRPAAEPPRQRKDKSKKRQANGEVKAREEDVSYQNGLNGERNGDDIQKNGSELTQDLNFSKRIRLDQEAEPVVTDTFETEQSREVAPSAGLQGTKDVESVILSHQVRHQVSLPPDYPYVPISEHKPPAEPARTWEFTLDPFQQVSIASIERGESVLVSAHTSAGKTVVAEYAIAQCLKNNQRVIYTSPIKALSNQKYREFLTEFSDVGLMTGDVTINPTATCLVMTTEILRSMLYRGSEIMREVGWVIFDEIHYLRDKMRGVVWEETIILLPDKVRYVFLSATIPNAMQFAEWITKTHNQPCHVVYTDFRPTPLQHYFFPAGANGIHLIVDEKGAFREDNFHKAMNTIAEKQGDDPAEAGPKRKGKAKWHTAKGGTKDGSDIYKIVRMIMTKNYNPVIVFSFSKRECEAHALNMSTMTFNDETEKAMVTKVFESALGMLSEEDKQLPQIQHILPLLRRGIGIHHSGLLPILKEAIEILFQEGLIKVLFATETFSIGLNMPAKTVVFTNVRKFDGVEMRWLTSSEFIQMSGRAGRRGLDDRGIVIMMIDEQMEPAVAKDVVRGEQDKLNSAFHLGYNMILNLLRVEGISPEFMLERCFLQFQNTASVADLEKQLHAMEADRQNAGEIEDEGTIRDYYDIRKQLDAYSDDMRDVLQHPNYSLSFIQPGRLVEVQHGPHAFGWGAVCGFDKRVQGRGDTQQLTPQDSWIIKVALICAAEPGAERRIAGDLPPGIRPAKPGEKGKIEVVPVLLSTIQKMSNIRIFMPQDLIKGEGRDAVRKALGEVKKRFVDGIPLLDPIEDLKITDESFTRLLRKISVLEQRLTSNPLHNSPHLPMLYDQYAEKVVKNENIRNLKRKIQEALSIIQLEELKCRKRVLRRLQFINEDEVVQLKARVACTISTGDELMLSELLLNGFFNDLSPEVCAAVLSCFIFEEKSKSDGVLREELAKPLRAIQEQARLIAKVSEESKLAVNEDEYVQSFKPELMGVVYEWAQGKSFADICKMTDVYEGSLIRVFRRLEEALRQMAEASKVMGNDELEKKFDEALNKIRRDIVAAQSLYL